MDAYKDPHILNQNLANFCKDQKANSLDFVGHTVSVTSAPLPLQMENIEVDEWTWLSSNKTLLLNT